MKIVYIKPKPYQKKYFKDQMSRHEIFNTVVPASVALISIIAAKDEIAKEQTYNFLFEMYRLLITHKGYIYFK